MDIEKQDSKTPEVEEKVDSVESESTSDVQHYGETRRALKSRHIQLIAMGGIIGTGLFVGSGAILSTVGPANLFMAYIVMSLILWNAMNCMGEIATYLPVKGASVAYYVDRFVDPSLAFAAGWNYWYVYAMLVSTEISAATLVVQYWTDAIPLAALITIFLLVCLLLNIFTVSWYGESEFWFASLKILGITSLIIIGVVLFFGGGPNHDRLGFRFWINPGAFREYLVDGSTGRFLGFWTALIRAGFAFMLAPELIIAAVGESEAPHRNIPKATRRFSYRLVIFYILGSLVIGIITPSNDPKLLQAIHSGKTGAGASPFVLGIQRAGIKGLNHVYNAMILTSAWSSGNSFMYASSRALYSLALSGQAPSVFRRCNRYGVPYVAVSATAVVSCIVYLNVSSSAAVVFQWFVNLTTTSGFIAWIVLFLCHIRFRQALIYHKAMDMLKFRTPLQPYYTWFTLFLMTVLTITNGFEVFFPGQFSASSFLAAYITIPLFMILYLGHKIWVRTPWIKKLEDIDIHEGKEEADRLEAKDVPPVPRNLLEKVWLWIA
ncbi:amino-acid permease inda1 [Neolentinus lepideus HHB14362 ss-1]|uniref:Amino-acid permease inda1 n=1 Tax=Neolentinus lepideus HHB14362 ss-1 TaxID=1314782 RepID=A0A165N1L4_9AGAM|nr:amino-acid permease inda1 [Neolentinus lepideus HHB14362 ss-1]